MHALKSAINKKTLLIIIHLPLSATEKQNPDKVLQGLKQHAEGLVNETIERRDFNRRNQKEGELFGDCVMTLREIATRLNFSKCCANCKSFQIRDNRCRASMSTNNGETAEHRELINSATDNGYL